MLKKLGILFSILCLLAALVYSQMGKISAPDITFTTIEGKKISMASLKGKVVLVNFWATDCTNCIKEMPKLVDAYNTYNAKGFEIIAVAMPYDPPAQVLNYVTQKKLPFPVMHDGLAEVIQKFGKVNATPTAYIFNKEGKRLQFTVGLLRFDDLYALLDRELG